MAGQCGTGRVVESDAGRAEVFGEVIAGAGAGDEQHVRCKIQQPGQRDLRWRGAEPGADGREYGIGEQTATLVAGQAQWAVRHERDVPGLAFCEHVAGSLVGQIEEVLDTDDIGLGNRAEQVLAGDVADADSVDEALVAGLDQGGELGVEPGPVVRSGPSRAG